jgi:hypothetical protein
MQPPVHIEHFTDDITILLFLLRAYAFLRQNQIDYFINFSLLFLC